jgi:hypothetical protein
MLNIDKFVDNKELRDKHVSALMNYYEIYKSYKYKSLIANHICTIYAKRNEWLSVYKLLSNFLHPINNAGASALSKIHIIYMRKNSHIFDCYKFYNSAAGMLEMKPEVRKSVELLSTLDSWYRDYFKEVSINVDKTYEDIDKIVGKFVESLDDVSTMMDYSCKIRLALNDNISKYDQVTSLTYLKSLISLFVSNPKIDIMILPFVINLLYPLVRAILSDKYVNIYKKFFEYYHRMYYIDPQKFHFVDIIIYRMSILYFAQLGPILAYRNSHQGSCAVCAKTDHGKTRLCSKCKDIRYCSDQCQREHWNLHKLSCGKVTSYDRYKTYIEGINITEAEVLEILPQLKALCDES